MNKELEEYLKLIIKIHLNEALYIEQEEERRNAVYSLPNKNYFNKKRGK